MHTDHRQQHDAAADADRLGRDASRRRFITKAAVAAPLVAVGTAALPVTRFLPEAMAAERPGMPRVLSDADLTSFALTLELALVELYGSAAKTGKLGTTNASVAKAFAGHHTDHADTLTTLVTNLATTAPAQTANAAVLKAFGPVVSGAADENALLDALRQLEEAAAATYTHALGIITNKAAAGTISTILPVEAQHAVVLGTAAKKPTTDYMPPFETEKAALDPATYPAGPATTSTTSASSSTDTGAGAGSTGS